MTNIITFVDLCLEGKALPDEIDDFVTRWHKKEAGVGMKLREYLGMSDREYAFWLRDSHAIYGVLDSHKRGQELDHYDEDYYELPLAARAPNANVAASIMDWLKKVKKL